MVIGKVQYGTVLFEGILQPNVYFVLINQEEYSTLPRSTAEPCVRFIASLGAKIPC